MISVLIGYQPKHNSTGSIRSIGITISSSSSRSLEQLMTRRRRRRRMRRKEDANVQPFPSINVSAAVDKQPPI